MNKNNVITKSIFEPSETELAVLAKHWWEQLVDIELWCFATGQSGSHERNARSQALARLAKLESFIGTAVVESTGQTVEDEFRKKLGDEYWRVFQNGSDEERRRVVEETNLATSAECDASDQVGSSEIA